MPSVADVFLRLRVDQSQLRRDITSGASGANLTGAGNNAGKQFGSGFRGGMSKDVSAGVADAQSKLGELSKRSTSFKIKADDKEANASLLAIKAKLLDLGAKTANPNIKMDGVAKALADIASVDVALDRLNKKTSNGNFITRLLGNGGGGAAGAGAGQAAGSGGGGLGGLLGAGAGVGAAGVLGGLLPAAGAIGSVGAFGGAGLGVAALGAQQLIGSKNVKGQDPTQGPLYAQAQTIGDQFSSTLKTAALGMLPALKSVMGQIPGIIRGLGPALTSVFSAAGGLLQPLVSGLTTLAHTALPLFAQGIRAVTPFIKPVIDGFTSLVRNLLPGMIAITKAATPAINALGQVLGILGKAFSTLLTGMIPGITASSALFVTLAKVIQTLAPFLAIVANTLAKLLAPAFATIQKLLVILMPVFTLLVKTLASFLGPALAAIGKLLLAMAPMLVILANALLKGLSPVLAAVVKLFIALTPVLLQLIAVIMPVLLPAINFLSIGLTGIVKWVTDAVQWFNKLPGPIRIAALAILAIGIALKLASANPIVAIVGAIILLTGVVIKYWPEISRTIVAAWHAVYTDAVAPLINFFTKTIPHAFDVTISAIKSTMGTWAPILATLVLGPVAGAVVFIVTHWDTVKRITLQVFGDIGKFFASFWGSTVRFFTSAVGSIGHALSAAWDAVSRVTTAVFGAIGRFFASFWGSTSRFISGVLGDIGRAFSSAWDFVSRTTSSIFGAIGRFFASFWGSTERFFSSTLGAIGRAISSAWTFVSSTTSSIFGAIGRFFAKWWGDTVSFFSSTLSHIRGGLSTAWNNIKADVSHIFGDIGAFFAKFWGDTEKFFGNVAGTVIRNTLSGAWRNISADAKILWKDIGHWFASGIHDGIGALDDVINFVTQKVLNPLISGYNAVNNIWSGTDITFRFPVLSPPKAAGGKVNEGTTDTADDVLVRVSKNETILSAAHSRILEGAGVLSALGVPGYAKGGKVLDGIPGFAAGGAAILADAVKYNGHKYVWGGAANPQTGWDCSSFVGYILGHDFGMALPGGVKWNPNVHGPTANLFTAQPGFKMVSHNINDIQAGDLLVENSGGHVGFGVGPNRMFSAYDTASGTIFSNAANMTNILRIGKGGGISPLGSSISPAQQKQYDAYIKLLNQDISLYSPAALTRAVELHPGPLPKGVLTAKGEANYKLMGGNYARNIKPAVQTQYNAVLAAAAAGAGTPGGDPAGGATGSEMANGKELYNYLLKNLFGGNKIAAAGAIASIWGESTWNPFAQGSGGRGLIGWTPASTISESDFRGGMKTQEPAILRFVTSSGDSSTIAQMFRATSVLEAANEWGHGVERFGINDVHSTGLALAKQIAGLKAGGRVTGMARGGTIREPMIGIGASGQVISLGEHGDESVIPGDVVSLLQQLIAAVHASSGKTAAGVARAITAPQATMAQAARAGAR